MVMRTVQEWLTTVVTPPRSDNIDDLHVDEVSSEYETEAHWLNGALTCLQEALTLRDQQHWPVTIAVGISLTSSEIPQGPTFAKIQDIVMAYDGTPPSLYCFQKGSEPWVTEPGYTELPIAFRAPIADETRSYFYEFYYEDGQEYRRTFWIAGPLTYLSDHAAHDSWPA